MKYSIKTLARLAIEVGSSLDLTIEEANKLKAELEVQGYEVKISINRSKRSHNRDVDIVGKKENVETLINESIAAERSFEKEIEIQDAMEWAESEGLVDSEKKLCIKAAFKNNTIKLYCNDQFFYLLLIEGKQKIKEKSLNEIVKNAMECIRTSNTEKVKEVIYTVLKDTLKENGFIN